MSRFVVSNYQMSILMEAEKKGISLKRMFEFKQGTAGSVFRRVISSSGVSRLSASFLRRSV